MMSSVFVPPAPLSLSGNVSENWKRFVQKFRNFVDANGKADVEEKIKIAMLLNLVGDEGLEVYNTFKYSAGEDEGLLETVIKKFEDYCTPLKNVIFERHKFSMIVQKEGQAFDSFLTELQKASSTCEYLEEENMVRDRIVFGISDKNLQERMLREPSLTLKKAADFCRAAEASKFQVRVFQEKQEKSIDAVRRSDLSKKPEARHMGPEKSYGKSKQFECYKCSYTHKYGACPAFGKACAICRQKNHFAKVCPNKVKRKQVYEIETAAEYENDNSDSQESSLYLDSIEVVCKSQAIHMVKNAEVHHKSWHETLCVGESKQKMRFKLDTGAETSIIPLSLFNSLKCKPAIQKTSSVLVAFEKSPIIPKGTVQLICTTSKGTSYNVNFTIVDMKSIPLLGLDACVGLNLVKRIAEVNCLKENSDELNDCVNSVFLKYEYPVEFDNVDSVFSKYSDVFDGLGKYSGQCHINLRNDVEPVVHAPRRVPNSLLNKLKTTLEDLCKKGIITPIDKPTDWVSSLVIVEKPNGKLRLCLDPKDLNKAIKRQHYVIPRAEDLLSKLGNKSIFTVIDMKEGFWQIELDSESSELCTFNSPFGRYCFNRLPYGLCCSPEIFQKRNNDTFGDIQGCEIYFDDLIIAASSLAEHDLILKKVLDRARDNNIKFNKDKTQFRVPQVKYVGQIISEKGLQPDPAHVKAIVDMSVPVNKTELLRLLGMSKFLAQFIPKLSELTAPLRQLIKKNVPWQWLPEHDKAISELKRRLIQAPVLSIFDSSKQLVVQTDSSQSGLGACLMQGGHPISYASRSLTDTESRYAQIEKELLSICYGVTKFHHFTYGRKVTVETDHKPLESVFKKDISKVSARLQRMLLKLLRYDLVVKYVPGKLLYMADTLSRAYLTDAVKDDPELQFVVHSFSKYVPMTMEKKSAFINETLKDNTLKMLIKYYSDGWPDHKNKCLSSAKCYYSLRDRITVEDGLVFLDHKLIIPTALRGYVLNKLHESHLGMVKTKLRAREVVHWPGMSTEIENFISKCSVCQKFQKSQCKEPLIAHPVPNRPWQRLAADILQFGPTDYLIVSDYYSRWVEILKLGGKTASDVIIKLKQIFSQFGIPEALVTDNMPFNSIEFGNFSKEWDFESVTCSPLHSQSNGLAEKFVSVAKGILRKAHEEGSDIFTALMEYRNTPLTDVRVSPAQIMLSRRLKTKVPACVALLQPQMFDKGIKQKLILNREKIKEVYNKSSKSLCPLNIGDSVLIKNNKIWEKGMVVGKAKTPRSYLVKQSNGRIVRRNRCWLRRSSERFEAFNPEVTYEMLIDVDNNNLVNGTNPFLTLPDTDSSNVTLPAPGIQAPCTRSGRPSRRPLRLIENL